MSKSNETHAMRILAAGLLLGACTSDVSEPPGSGTYAVTHCADGTCAEGHVCSADLCLVACGDHSHCPDGAVCHAGACLAASDAACHADGDCAHEGVCIDGHCAAAPADIACMTDHDCPDGSHCGADHACVHGEATHDTTAAHDDAGSGHDEPAPHDGGHDPGH